MGADMPAARKSSGRGVDRKRDFVSVLAALGRYGDNTVGHLTDGEIVIPREVVDQDPSVLTPFIRAMTKRGDNWRRFVVGQGDRNPNTGVQEFASKNKDTSGSQGKSPSSAPGGGSTGGYSGGGGGTNRAWENRERLMQDPTRRVGPVAGTRSVPTAPYEGTNRDPSFQDGGVMGSAGSRPGGPAAVGEPGMFEQMLGDAVGPPSGRSLGALGTALGLVPGIGTLMGFTNLMQNVFGIEGEMDWEAGNPNPMARDSPNEGRMDYRAPLPQQIKGLVAAAAANGLIDAPGWLKSAVAGLSPLQQRAYIATQGTAGGDSNYRGRDTFDYYRGLVTDGVSDYGSVLPVEHQYLRDIWGANYQPSTSALMKALAAL